MITHYKNDSANAEWIAEHLEMETDDSWSPAQPRYRHVVSHDFASGVADEPVKEIA